MCSIEFPINISIPVLLNRTGNCTYRHSTHFNSEKSHTFLFMLLFMLHENKNGSNLLNNPRSIRPSKINFRSWYPLSSPLFTFWCPHKLAYALHTSFDIPPNADTPFAEESCLLSHQTRMNQRPPIILYCRDRVSSCNIYAVQQDTQCGLNE